MKKFEKMINWDNLHLQSVNFKKNKPFKFAFIENFFKREFYDKLYSSYPKIDDAWKIGSDHSKYQFLRFWSNYSSANQIVEGHNYDSNFSQEWNEFKEYAHSDEFISNFREFSGVKVTRLKHFHFMAYKKGGFQLPHIHNVGPSTLILMLYFSKNWRKGDAGGTYMASELDESKIIFEPYNLDNSVALFHDGPKAAHGTRYITKDVTRQAVQITLEAHSPEFGWSGKESKQIKNERQKKAKTV